MSTETGLPYLRLCPRISSKRWSNARRFNMPVRPSCSARSASWALACTICSWAMRSARSDAWRSFMLRKTYQAETPMIETTSSMQANCTCTAPRHCDRISCSDSATVTNSGLLGRCSYATRRLTPSIGEVIRMIPARALLTAGIKGLLAISRPRSSIAYGRRSTIVPLARLSDMAPFSPMSKPLSSFRM